ncbi:MAG: DNA-3-methyladenine glycosylase [Solirubrobacteraceae bacterium]
MSDREFFARPVLDVARDLVGWTVRHGDTAGMIVETEAYHQDEAACHAHAGVTARTSTLFGPPGLAYVYRSYGIHALLNVVCEPKDVGAAVLVRALDPSEGLDLMRARRRLDREQDLCSGPGKLTQALDVGLHHNETDLLGAGPVRLEPPQGPLPAPVAGPRIGITKAAELPWRFCATGSRNVSKPWPPGLRETVPR